MLGPTKQGDDLKQTPKWRNTFVIKNRKVVLNCIPMCFPFTGMALGERSQEKKVGDLSYFSGFHILITVLIYW